MPSPRKPKTGIFYSFQLWMTSALLGPFLWYYYPEIRWHSLLTFGETYWIAVLIAIVFTIPSFLFLWAAVTFLQRQAWVLLLKKWLLALWATVLCFAPFLLLHSWNRSLFSVASLVTIGAYLLPLLSALFLFPWPTAKLFS